MDRFTAIIVDDERLARKELRSMLAEPEIIDVVGEAETVVLRLSWYMRKTLTWSFSTSNCRARPVSI